MPVDPELWEISDDSSESGIELENDRLPTIDRLSNNSVPTFAEAGLNQTGLGDKIRTDDVEDAFEWLKAGLRDHFDRIDCGVEFSHQGILPNAPNPGLFIEGYGTVGFPLTEHDFGRIVAASHSASSEHPVDTVPSHYVYRIPGDRVRAKNPAWVLLVQSVLQKVTLELGIEHKSASAELNSLIYHASGGTIEMIK